jgi:hypothetical protein
MTYAAIALGVYLAGVALYWLFAGAMLLASLQPDDALAFRKRFRFQPFRDTFCWPWRVLSRLGTIRKAALLPFGYLFRVQTIGCFVRKREPPLSCSDAFLLNNAKGRGRINGGKLATPYPLEREAHVVS